MRLSRPWASSPNITEPSPPAYLPPHALPVEIAIVVTADPGAALSLNPVSQPLLMPITASSTDRKRGPRRVPRFV